MLNVEQELFKAYAFYAGVVIMKMLLVTFLIIRQRFKNKVFISPEDALDRDTKV